MKVRSERDEIVNLDSVREYTLEGNILVVRDGDRFKKYTLTEESTEKLSDYLEKNIR